MATTPSAQEIINTGIQRKKSKQEIMQKLIEYNQYSDSSRTYLNTLDKDGMFSGGVKQTGDPLDIDRSSNTAPENAAYNYGTRTYQSGKTIEDLESTISQKSFTEALGQKVQEKLVGGTTTQRFVDPEFQKFDQAKRDFVNAVLRRESGAVISQEEFDNATKQYFPLPGDSAETVEQKRKNRQLVTKNLLEEGGVDVSLLEAKTPISTQAEVDAKLEKQYEYATTHPEDPRSAKFLDAWNNKKIDLTTGELKEEFKPKSEFQMELEKRKREEGLITDVKKKDTEVTGTVPVEGQEMQEDGLMSKLGQRAANIGQELVDVVPKNERSYFADLIQPVRTGLRIGGQTMGAVGDVTGAVVEMAFDKATTPEQKEQLKQVATQVMQSDLGQKGLQALQLGEQSWSVFKKENPEIAKDLEASFSIVTNLPIAKGGSVAVKEAKNIAGDVIEAGVRTAGKDVVASSSDDVFRAVKPTLTVDRNKKTVKQVLQSANRDIITSGKKPTNLKEYAEALSTTRKEVWGAIENKIGDGGTTKVNLKSIADEVMEIANDPNLARVDAGTVDKIKRIAESLVAQGDEISVADAESLKQLLNAELKGTFGKFNLSKTEQNAKKLITSKIGEQLDNVLSSVPGEFKDLKNRYGALRQVEDDVLKRLIVFERQNPAGLIDSVSKISGIGNIIQGVFTLNPASIARGAGEIAVGQLQNKMNDADDIIKRSFEKMYKRSQEYKPKSKTLNYMKGKGGLSIQDVSGGKAGYGDDLIQEAKKYKSAEEFVKGRKIAYHGQMDKEPTVQSVNGKYGTGFYLGDTKSTAEYFGKTRVTNGGRVYDEKAVPKIGEFDISNLNLKKFNGDAQYENLLYDRYGNANIATKNEFAKSLQSKGLDGVDIGNGEIVVFDKAFNKIKTKSQLEEIWKKAQGKNKVDGKPSNLPIIGDKGNVKKPKNRIEKIAQDVTMENIDVMKAYIDMVKSGKFSKTIESDATKMMKKWGAKELTGKESSVVKLFEKVIETMKDYQ